MALPTVDMQASCCKKERCLSGPNAGQVYDTCDPCRGIGRFDPGTCDCVDLGTGFISMRYWIIERRTNRYLCFGETPIGDTCWSESPLLRSWFANDATLLSFDYGTTNAVRVLYGNGCDCPGTFGDPAAILNLYYIDHEDNDIEKTMTVDAGTGSLCTNTISSGETRDKYVYIETLKVNTGDEVIDIIDREAPSDAVNACFDTPYPSL